MATELTPQAVAQIRRWIMLLATDDTAPAWIPVVQRSTPFSLRRAALWIVERGHAPGMDPDMVGILLALFMIDIPLDLSAEDEAEFLPQDAA
jgi:hypothetical protein